jgi:O-antigen/teichoic acid export membrane protein
MAPVATAEKAETDEKSQVSQLFGRDAVYLVVWAVQLLCAALFTPVLTRVLGADQFGTVTSGNAIMQILFIVAGLGLQAAVQREHAGNGDLLGARRLLGFGMIAAGAITFMVWATVNLWSPAIGLHGDQLSLQLSVIWAGLSAVTNLQLGLLRSEDRIVGFCVVGLLQSVAAEGLSLLLAEVLKPTAHNFLWGQMLAQLAATLIGLFLVPPAMLWWKHAEFLGLALMFALPLVPSTLATFVLSTSDRLIVEAQLGSEAVARYQVAYNVAGMPMLLLSVLSSAWMPRLFSLTDESERGIVLRESRDALSRLMLPVVLGFAFGAPLVLRIWAPAEYKPDQLQFVVAIVLITVVPFAAQLAVTRNLMMEGRTGAIAAANAVAAAVNFGLNLVLIPRYHLFGSAVATLVAYLVIFVILARIGRSTSPGPAPWSLRLSMIGACVVAIGAAAVPESTPVMVARVVLGAITVAWFLRTFLQINKRPAAEGGLEESARIILARGVAIMPPGLLGDIPVVGRPVVAMGRASIRNPVALEETTRIYYGGRYV